MNLSMLQVRIRVALGFLAIFVLSILIIKFDLTAYIRDYVPPELVGWMFFLFVILYTQYNTLFSLKIKKEKARDKDAVVEKEPLYWLPIYGDIVLSSFFVRKKSPLIAKIIAKLHYWSLAVMLFSLLYFNVLRAFIENDYLTYIFIVASMVSSILYILCKTIIVISILNRLSTPLKACWGIVFFFGYIAIIYYVKHYLHQLEKVQVDRSYGFRG